MIWWHTLRFKRKSLGFLSVQSVQICSKIQMKIKNKILMHSEKSWTALHSTRKTQRSRRTSVCTWNKSYRSVSRKRLITLIKAFLVIHCRLSSKPLKSWKRHLFANWTSSWMSISWKKRKLTFRHCCKSTTNSQRTLSWPCQASPCSNKTKSSSRALSLKCEKLIKLNCDGSELSHSRLPENI